MHLIQTQYICFLITVVKQAQVIYDRGLKLGHETGKKKDECIYLYLPCANPESRECPRIWHIVVWRLDFIPILGIMVGKSYIQCLFHKFQSRYLGYYTILWLNFCVVKVTECSQCFRPLHVSLYLDYKVCSKMSIHTVHRYFLYHYSIWVIFCFCVLPTLLMFFDLIISEKNIHPKTQTLCP